MNIHEYREMEGSIKLQGTTEVFGMKSQRSEFPKEKRVFFVFFVHLYVPSILKNILITV